MTTSDYFTRFLDIRSQLIDAKAEALGKSRCDLVPWADYDPIMIEYEARYIAQDRGIMWTGD